MSQKQESAFDLIKDPLYQSLLAVRGWTLRAENLLLAKKVNPAALETALWQIHSCCQETLKRYFSLVREGRL